MPVARTIGPDRVVDEIIFCFTHTCEIDFLIPGVAPTGKYVEVPTVVVIEFRGDKLYNEHIYWDQGSMLAQLGVLDVERPADRWNRERAQSPGRGGTVERNDADLEEQRGQRLAHHHVSTTNHNFTFSD